mmetsp:Transcript_33331/g.66341  ORF Transcript_33331/g.66341 Transcript_33331/m.66341 type:complete len:91 (-) Transcript_33331:68-340(-)
MLASSREISSALVQTVVLGRFLGILASPSTRHDKHRASKSRVIEVFITPRLLALAPLLCLACNARVILADLCITCLAPISLLTMDLIQVV